MEYLSNGWKQARGLGRRFGPYLLLEALMPGGTLLAAALYVYRHRKECTR
jgi:hypothetical protein